MCETNHTPAAAREFSVKSNGREIAFTSTLSNAEMLQTLFLMSNGSNFARDLYRVRDRLSSAQLAWGHKLAVDHLRPAAVAVAAPLNMSQVFDLLDTAAASGLKYPKLRFGLSDGRVLTLSVAGPMSKAPGTMKVVTGSRANGDDVFRGRARRGGDFSAARNCPPEVFALLESLAADPRAVIVANGRLNGVCCFCARVLSDARSLAAGYGDTCAGNWGMPWGAASMSAASLVSAAVPEWVAADNAALAAARADDEANPGRFDNLDRVPCDC